MMAADLKFREKLKDILLHREELDTSFHSACDCVNGVDDVEKLSGLLLKTEKMLKEWKGRLYECNGQSSNDADKLSAASLSGPLRMSDGEPSATGNDAKTGESLSEGHKSKVFLGKPIQPKDANKKKWIPNQRKPDIPDSQRIFLPQIKKITSEETLRNYFSRFGQVVDVKVFCNENGNPRGNAVVGFSSEETVQSLLPQTFTIDGQNLTARPYYPAVKNDESGYSGGYAAKRAPVRNERFQIFLGGVPVYASRQQVIDAMSIFGKVNDCRMTFKSMNGQSQNRGYAYVDFDPSVNVSGIVNNNHFVNILGKQVECKMNTVPFNLLQKRAISTSHADLAALLPQIPIEVPKVSTSNNISGQVNGATNAMASNSKVSASTTVPVNSENADRFCMVCYKKTPDCVLLWCGHVLTCYGCATNLKQCPRCNEPVHKVNKFAIG